MYIYLDESGDLGFTLESKGSSKHFVITILLCLNNKARQEFKKAIQRTIKNKINKKKKKSYQELKGTRTPLNVKKYFLRQIKNEDWKIYSLILDKSLAPPNVRTRGEKKKLYNFLSRVLLEELGPLIKETKEKVELVVDKSKNSEEIKDFNSYLENQLEALLPLSVPLNIYHLHSVESYELQAIDLFCWGIFRKFELGDCEWYNYYSHKLDSEIEYSK